MGRSASHPSGISGKGLWSQAAVLVAILASFSWADELSAACVDQTMFYTSDSEAPSVLGARPSVVVLGSSTAEGYYGPSVFDRGYVWRLASLLSHRKPGECLTNLAVQGYSTFDTRSSSLPRVPGQDTSNPSRDIDKALELRPALVLIHLPTNDAFDGIPFDSSRANLLDMVRRADSAGSKVLLVGPLPRNNPNPTQLSLLLEWKQFFDTLSITEVVNPWDSVADAADSTRINPALGYVAPGTSLIDGIHLNDSGQAILFRMVSRSRTWRSIVPGDWDATDSLPVGAVDSFSMSHPGVFFKGAHLDFTVNYSRPVTVQDSAYIRLTIGRNRVFARYDSGTGTARIRFRYTVKPDDVDSGGILVARWIGSSDSSILDSFGKPVATNIVSIDPSDTIRIFAHRPPVVISPLRDTSLLEEFTVPLVYLLDSCFVDSDGSISTFRLSGDSTVVRYALAHDTLRITSRADAFGTDSIVVRATDNYGDSVSDTFAVTILRVNKPPVVTSPLRDTTLYEGFDKPIVLPLATHFHDSDGVIQSYRLWGDSSVVRYALAHDTLRIAVLPNAWGNTSLVVTAMDDSGASISDTFLVSVTRTTSIEAPHKPVQPIAKDGNPAEFTVVTAIASRIPSASGSAPPLLSLASRGSCDRDRCRSSIAARLGVPGVLWAAIFDNLGNPVLEGSWRIGRIELDRMPRIMGKPTDVLLWNQRDGRGETVPTGVYIWKVGFLPDNGNNVEAVYRLGVRPEAGP